MTIELTTADGATIGAYEARPSRGIAKMAGAKPRCPVEMHFGERDDHIPMMDIDTIKAARTEIPV